MSRPLFLRSHVIVKGGGGEWREFHRDERAQSDTVIFFDPTLIHHIKGGMRQRSPPPRVWPR